jgi:thiol:disulfide interchange protein DsbD
MRMTIAAFALALALPAGAAPVQQPHSQAELVPERAVVTPGQPLTVGLHLRLEDGWHVYWKNPGDAGMPTSIAWTLPQGFSAGRMEWPAPRRIDVPPLTSYGYEGEVMHLTEIQVPADAKPGAQVTIRAKADWLVCKEICIPASADFSRSLSVSSTPGNPDPRWAEAFAKARSAAPLPLAGWQATAYRDGDTLLLQVAPEAAGAPHLHGLEFFPEREGVIANAVRQTFARLDKGYEVRMTASPQPIGELNGLAGVLVADPGFGAARAVEIDVPFSPGPAPAAAASAGFGLAMALVLAFAGGLILNLMPCVFPVLAIKVLGVAQQAHSHPAKLRTHGLLFALGVVLSFWAIAGLLLALRAGSADLGWGYQLQSPMIVAGLALLFFVLGLNLSGVFQIGTGVQALAGGIRARNEQADALLSGLLATLVASPCTAPFMGAALGFALVQPALSAMLVFTALALGMALPYLVLCFVPALIRRLPRPGRWMETLRQALAFPLYATVVWLVWVLGQQAGIDGAAKLLAALVAVAAALWAVGHWAHAGRSARMTARVAALILIGGALVFAWPQGQPGPRSQARAEGAWQPWSEAAVSSALAAGKPVFVDFTAAWCVTCQVNKRLVLSAADVEQRFVELGVTRLRADWTNRDGAITAALARLNRIGVPVYALYSPAQREPLLLPEVLTRSVVLDALQRAAPPAAPSYAISPEPATSSLAKKESP